MKDYSVIITVNDPYPKSSTHIIKASTIEVAIKRVIREWREKGWAGRPLKSITVHATLLS